jgi:hypothetical protein
LNGVIFAKRPYIKRSNGSQLQARQEKPDRTERFDAQLVGMGLVPDMGPDKWAGHDRQGEADMWRLIKFLFTLAILGGIALVAYAYVGPFVFPDHFTPPVRQIVAPVTLDLS